MALGGKKKTKGKSGGGEKREAQWVTIFDVCESDKYEGRLYAKANKYKGRLLWQQFGGENGDDEENSTFFVVNSANIFEPRENAPDFVKNTVVINLKNEKSAEAISED